MKRLLQSFSDKKFKYGSFSTLMIIFVIAIFVVVNMVTDQLQLNFDLTANKFYSISDDSKEIVNKLTEDVTIYALARTGEESNMYSNAVGALTFQQMLQEYEKSSGHIKISYRDPYLNPQFVSKYTGNGEQIPVNSLIVEGVERYKVILPTEMITTDVDYQTYQQYVKSVDIEPRITNAITYVTSGSSATIYAISGSNEEPMPDSFKSRLGLANFDVKEVNLATSAIPEDCDILFAAQPSRDWTSDAAEKVKTFLQNDGRLILTVGFIGADFPNLNSVLQSYGFQLGSFFVYETEPDHYVVSDPFYLLPEFASHDITQPLADKNLRTLLIQTAAAELTDIKKNSVKIEPLLISSAQAYSKSVEAKTMDKEAGDKQGPFSSAIAVTDSYYTDVQHTTKIVFVATSSILNEYVNGQISGANWDFLVNSLNWLTDVSDTVYIAPKTPEANQRLTITGVQAATFGLLAVIVLPLIILGAGLSVWLRRRHS